MSKAFQLDLMAIGAEAGQEIEGVRILCGAISDQIHDAGGPDGDLDAQLRVLLADHEAMQEAGEEMPSEEEIADDIITQTGKFCPVQQAPAVEVALERCRPIVARLRRERDEAQANPHVAGKPLRDAIAQAPVVRLSEEELAELDAIEHEYLDNPPKDLVSTEVILFGLLKRAREENDVLQASLTPLKTNNEFLQGMLNSACAENDELRARLARVDGITTEDVNAAYNGEHHDASPERVVDFIRSRARSEGRTP